MLHIVLTAKNLVIYLPTVLTNTVNVVGKSFIPTTIFTIPTIIHSKIGKLHQKSLFKDMVSSHRFRSYLPLLTKLSTMLAKAPLISLSLLELTTSVKTREISNIKTRHKTIEIDIENQSDKNRSHTPQYSKTLKYWVGVQWGKSYLMGRRCLFSLGWPPFLLWYHNKNTLWGRYFITSTSLALIFSHWVG